MKDEMKNENQTQEQVQVKVSENDIVKGRGCKLLIIPEKELR